MFSWAGYGGISTHGDAFITPQKQGGGAARAARKKDRRYYPSRSVRCRSNGSKRWVIIWFSTGTNDYRRGIKAELNWRPEHCDLSTRSVSLAVNENLWIRVSNDGCVPKGRNRLSGSFAGWTTAKRL